MLLQKLSPNLVKITKMLLGVALELDGEPLVPKIIFDFSTLPFGTVFGSLSVESVETNSSVFRFFEAVSRAVC